ncbi:glycosyltransferase, partial [Burkholderia sp. LMG 13014]|uniref:glycosyltransferase family 2 protein n=1 Tax=Burkholderia sp. LMG 13014 TaxID=2709306 RepID=UPI0027DBEEDD
MAACARDRRARQPVRDPAARPVRRARRAGGRLPGRRRRQFLLHPFQAAPMTSPDCPPPLDDVAVLMPAYNGHDDVVRTLASFREDTPVHVLIVDDGSTPPIVAPDLPGLAIEVLRMPQNG